jgi:hypothetical protein
MAWPFYPNMDPAYASPSPSPRPRHSAAKLTYTAPLCCSSSSDGTPTPTIPVRPTLEPYHPTPDTDTDTDTDTVTDTDTDTDTTTDLDTTPSVAKKLACTVAPLLNPILCSSHLRYGIAETMGEFCYFLNMTPAILAGSPPSTAKDELDSREERLGKLAIQEAINVCERLAEIPTISGYRTLYDAKLLVVCQIVFAYAFCAMRDMHVLTARTEHSQRSYDCDYTLSMQELEAAFHEIPVDLLEAVRAKDTPAYVECNLLKERQFCACICQCGNTSRSQRDYMREYIEFEHPECSIDAPIFGRAVPLVYHDLWHKLAHLDTYTYFQGVRLVHTGTSRRIHWVFGDVPVLEMSTPIRIKPACPYPAPTPTPTPTPTPAPAPAPAPK